MENFKSLALQFSETAIFRSVIVVILGFFFYKTLSFLITKSGNRFAARQGDRKSKTYVKLIHSILRYVFIIITLIVLLQVNGIDASSMLAGVGILGLVLGFAVQDVLKDILKGFNLVSDGYFHVGDIVTYKDMEGKVLSIGMLTTKIEDIRTSDIVSISNRNIDQASILSDKFYLRLPLPYELPLSAAESVMNEIVARISELDAVSLCLYKGVAELGDSAILYLLQITCPPDAKLQTKRDALRCALLVYEERSISVPYPQLDVHQK